MLSKTKSATILKTNSATIPKPEKESLREESKQTSLFSTPSERLNIASKELESFLEWSVPSKSSFIPGFKDNLTILYNLRKFNPDAFASCMQAFQQHVQSGYKRGWFSSPESLNYHARMSAYDMNNSYLNLRFLYETLHIRLGTRKVGDSLKKVIVDFFEKELPKILAQYQKENVILDVERWSPPMACIPVIEKRDILIGEDVETSLKPYVGYHLKKLNIKDAITDKQLIFIAKNFPNLEELDIESCSKITELGFEHLANLSKLKSLSLFYSFNISVDGFDKITKLSNLSFLLIQGGQKINAEGFDKLKNLRNLKFLVINECEKMTDESLESICSGLNLTGLSLGNCSQITDKGLEHLAKQTFLQQLSLEGCSEITDKGLEHLAKQTYLKQFSLDGCSQITDKGLEHLANLIYLKQLSLKGCSQITDNGFAHVAKLENLEYLILEGCSQITDDGLKYLESLTKLKRCDLISYAAGITKEGLLNLKKSIPRVEIHTDRHFL
jgi:hypothetical protein